MAKAKASTTKKLDTQREIISYSVDSLVLDPENARKHAEVDIDAIAKSLKQFGQQTPIVITSDLTVIKGNGTLMAAMSLGWKQIDAIQTSLTGNQLRAYAIADNQTGLLSEWDTDRLIEQLKILEASEPSLIDSLGFSQEDLDEFLPAADDSINLDNPYTSKTDVPVYAKIGNKPSLGAIFDIEYAQKLIKEIDASDVSDEEKHFLRAAAYRHVKFNFQEIANYYAHSAADVQRLFENSALVIVDLQFAIQNGWTRLGESLDEIYGIDKGQANDPE